MSTAEDVVDVMQKAGDSHVAAWLLPDGDWWYGYEHSDFEGDYYSEGTEPVLRSLREGNVRVYAYPGEIGAQFIRRITAAQIRELVKLWDLADPKRGMIQRQLGDEGMAFYDMGGQLATDRVAWGRLLRGQPVMASFEATLRRIFADDQPWQPGDRTNQNPTDFTVGDWADSLLGYITWRKDSEIQSVWVHQEWRRLGIASQLLRKAEELVGHELSHSTELTRDGEGWARSFFESMRSIFAADPDPKWLKWWLAPDGTMTEVDYVHDYTAKDKFGRTTRELLKDGYYRIGCYIMEGEAVRRIHGFDRWCELTVERVTPPTQQENDQVLALFNQYQPNTVSIYGGDTGGYLDTPDRQGIQRLLGPITAPVPVMARVAEYGDYVPGGFKYWVDPDGQVIPVMDEHAEYGDPDALVNDGWVRMGGVDLADDGQLYVDCRAPIRPVQWAVIEELALRVSPEVMYVQYGQDSMQVKRFTDLAEMERYVLGRTAAHWEQGDSLNHICMACAEARRRGEMAASECNTDNRCLIGRIADGETLNEREKARLPRDAAVPGQPENPEGYQVTLTSQAQKDMKKLDPQSARKIQQALDGMATVAFPPQSKRQTGPLTGYYRIAVGDSLRIFYSVEGQDITVIGLGQHEGFDRKMQQRVGEALPNRWSTKFCCAACSIEAQRRHGAWEDVLKKAIEIYNSGAATIEQQDDLVIKAKVQGEHDLYDVIIHLNSTDDPSPMSWACGCEWGFWAWQRQHDYRGRPCSHCLAAFLVSKTMQQQELSAPVEFELSPTQLVRRRKQDYQKGKQLADWLQNTPPQQPVPTRQPVPVQQQQQPAAPTVRMQ